MATVVPAALGLEEQGDWAAFLESLGQGHLLEGLEQEERRRLLEHVRHLNGTYSGGLKAYIANARRLLEASARGDNPFEGLTPSVPEGERLTYGSERFNRLELLGLQQVRRSAFVLVAGGLGERLGFSGIKLALPLTVVNEWCFLEFYCRSILALQSQSVPGLEDEPEAVIPLVIMTSEDTHGRTLELLQRNDNFGLRRDQIHVLRQEKVPCLMDSEARLARHPKDPGQIETKPHGHGDVHALLHTSGLAQQLLKEEKRWIIFFQDTSGLFFKAILAAVGLSAECGFSMNSLAVPRRPKDAMGGIAKLTGEDGSSLTINVEYNQLDPLLRNTICPDGDVADETGLSPFPGNMNSLVLALHDYVTTLERTAGNIAEFVNPKYADSTRTAFKSSTRLECMMQDFPKELPKEALVGFTMLESWCSYSPVKNSPAEALKKFQTGNHPQSGTTGETDLFAANCKILRMCGVEVDPAEPAEFNGIQVDLEARVVWTPDWAASLHAVRARIAPEAKVHITQRSTLILDGEIVLEGLELDGTLIIRAAPGARVIIRRYALTNPGWELSPVGEDDTDEVNRIRGFRVLARGSDILEFKEPGEHIVDQAAPTTSGAP